MYVPAGPGLVGKPVRLTAPAQCIVRTAVVRIPNPVADLRIIRISPAYRFLYGIRQLDREVHPRNIGLVAGYLEDREGDTG